MVLVTDIQSFPLLLLFITTVAKYTFVQCDDGGR
jgi:hypothetical protein